MAIYHYYAMHQIRPGELFHMDGLVTNDEAILSAEHYAELKNLLGKRYGVPGDRLTICSLSRLDHREE